MKNSNLIQKFFLFLIDHPFILNFIFWLLGFMLLAIFYDPEVETSFLKWFSIALLFNLIILYLIRWKYFTMHRSLDYYSHDDYYKWAYIFVPDKGNIFVMKKPVFSKKGKRFSLEKPDLITDNSENPKAMRVVVPVKFDYKHTFVCFECIFYFQINPEVSEDKFKLKLFEKMSQTLNGSSLHISREDYKKYVESVFIRSNPKEKHTEVVKKWVNSNISSRVLLQEIAEATEFPNKVFSFEEEIVIEFSEPKVYVCKGANIYSRVLM